MSTRLAQVVDGRQQQFRHFLTVSVDDFQVAAQHMQGIADGRQLAIALTARPGGDIGGLLQHFLRQQFGACQLDQLEGAAHLLEVFDCLLQQAAVLALGNKMLKAQLGFIHGGEQLIAHQTKGCGSSNHWPSTPPARGRAAVGRGQLPAP